MTRSFALLLLAFGPLLCACSDDGTSDSASGIVTTFGTESASASMSGPGTSDSQSTDTQTSDSQSSDSDTQTSAEGSTDTEGSGDSFCVHQCQSDADCLSNGMDTGLSCVDNLCTSEVSGCSDDDYCVAFLSGWTVGTPCTPGGGECDAAMQICLEVEGSGHCALAPSDFIDCEGIGFDEIPTTDINGNPVIVCGRASAACHPDGYCWLPCQADADCLSEAYPLCNPNTGTCECASDAGCASLGSPQFSMCNGGICGCGSDDDCLAGSAGDVCTSSGSCGCSDDAACVGVQNPYDGGAVECVEF